MTSMSRRSSETMCTSAEDWRCHEHVRHMRLPKRSWAHTSSSSAVIDSKSTSGSCAVAKQDLLERVAAQTTAQRLERNDLVGRDVPEIHGRSVLLDEPHLRALRRRFEDHVLQRKGGRDFVD